MVSRNPITTDNEPPLSVNAGIFSGWVAATEDIIGLTKAGVIISSELMSDKSSRTGGGACRGNKLPEKSYINGAGSDSQIFFCPVLLPKNWESGTVFFWREVLVWRLSDWASCPWPDIESRIWRKILVVISTTVASLIINVESYSIF